MSGTKPEGRMLAAALRYASIGWYVFPLREKGDIKAPHPALGAKEGHRKATLDESQIREWWNAHPNAGIGVWLQPSGLIAIDIDPRDGGDKALRELEKAHGDTSSPVQATTGGGGEHRLFKAPEGLTSPPGKVLRTKGIDLKFNGYIAVSPSPHPYPNRELENGQVPARRYRWQKNASPFDAIEFMSEVPAWVLQHSAPGSALTRPINGHDVFAEDTAKVGFTFERISAVLDSIPNSGDRELDYEDWLNVLAGIYHETDGNGRELAEEWSARSLKHVDEKFDKSWKSLSIEGKGRAPITFRFAMKLANEYAAEVSAEAKAEILGELKAALNLPRLRDICGKIKVADLDAIDRSFIVAEVQRAYHTITGNRLSIRDARDWTRYEIASLGDAPRWLEGWVYCAREDQFFRTGSEESLSPSAFNNRFDIHMLSHKDRLEGAAYPAIRAADAALKVFDIPKVYGRMYLPTTGKFFDLGGTPYANTFSATGQPEVPTTLKAEDHANVLRIEDHFKHLIADRREREIVMSWLAYIIQSQGRINWCPVLQGPQEDGKTFLCDMMAVLLGERNVKIVDPGLIESSFTDWAEGALLTVFEEIKLHGAKRYDLIDKLKPYITNAGINVHPKGLKPRNVVNTASYMAFTNYRDALPLDGNDTRYFLVASPRQRRAEVVDFNTRNPTYFAELYAALENSPGAIRNYFLQYRTHIEFNSKSRAPYSREKSLLAELNKGDIEVAIESLIAEGRHTNLSATLLDTIALADYLLDVGEQAPQTYALKNLLLNQLGYTYLGKYKVDGRYHRYWSRTPARFVGSNDAATAKAIREYLRSEGL